MQTLILVMGNLGFMATKDVLPCHSVFVKYGINFMLADAAGRLLYVAGNFLELFFVSQESKMFCFFDFEIPETKLRQSVI